MVTEDAVMGDVCVRHNQAVRAYDRATLSGCATVYGDTFAKCCVVSDDDSSVFSRKLQVLGNSRDDSAGEDGAVLADTRAGEDGDIAVDACAITNLNVLVYRHEGADLHVLAYLGIGMYV
jgi:hypothetical protein